MVLFELDGDGTCLFISALYQNISAQTRDLPTTTTASIIVLVGEDLILGQLLSACQLVGNGSDIQSCFCIVLCVKIISCWSSGDNRYLVCDNR